MPKKIQDCSRAHLISVPLPQHAASYTVITHQFVIDHSFQALANAGFVVVDEEYRCTADGQIAQGIYKLQYNNDPDLSMMFAWTNSYNKQVKFKCLIGAYINQTGTVMTSGDIGTWTRKHIGTADVETKATIDDQVINANMYYNQLVADKAIMTGISLNKRKQAQLLGILFAEYQILTTEQASIIRGQMDRPSYVFEDSNSLWAFYNYVTIALQHSHPRTWMEDQRILHYFISTVGNFNAPPQPVIVPEVEEEEAVVDELANNYGQPENQTNLLVQIAEIELADNQVVQIGSDFDIDVHQSEEIILEANEAEEDHVIIEDEIWTTEEEPQKIATIVDATVEYTDPAGNTFEAPIVVDDFISDEEEDMIMDQILIPIAPCAAHDTETEKDLEQEIRETEVANFFEEITPVPTLVPTPEEHAQFEAEEALYVEPEANLDLKESVAEVKEDNSSDFDFDFGSDDPEDAGADNTPDFF
jgi:hypothetical protein